MSYVAEVAELFMSRCSNVKILSPMDYVIISEWEKRGIPIEVVSTVIREICDELPVDGMRVESVSYFQEPVKQKFRSWLQTDARA